MYSLSKTLLGGVMAGVALNVAAQEITFALSIPAQPLASALGMLRQQTGLHVFYAEDIIKGKTGAAVEGRFSAAQAVARLLAGSGLAHTFTASDTVAIKQAETGGDATLPAVTVLGKTVYDSTDPYNADYTRVSTSTATKTDTPIMQTPANIQVVTRKVMDDQQAITLQDAVKNVAGVQPGFGGGHLNDIFTIRGFGTAPFDVYSSTSVFREGMWLSFVPLSTASLDRIEVLKGPAAVLYGRMEPGGLINAVPKDALKTPCYSLQQQFGSYNLFRTSLDATGPLSAGGDVRYRTNVDYLDNGSFVAGGFNQQLNVAPNLTWDISANTTLELELNYQHQNLITNPALPALGRRPADISISRNLGDGKLGTHLDRDDYVVDLDLEHRFNDDWKINWKGGYVHTEYKEQQTAGYALDENSGDFNRYYYTADSDRNQFFTSLNLTSSRND